MFNQLLQFICSEISIRVICLLSNIARNKNSKYEVTMKLILGPVLDNSDI
jgi:hypothetical protein